jgi:SNF2 family DNA or RNA helicase
MKMPKKTDNVVFCPLSPAQLYAYKRIRAIPRVQCLLDGHPEEKGDLLRFLDTLIKVSNHVSLVLPCKLEVLPVFVSLSYTTQLQTTIKSRSSVIEKWPP